jgi:spore germination protein
MIKKTLLLFVILTLLIIGVRFYYFGEIKETSVILQDDQSYQEEKSEEKKFFISGWLPYWRKTEGVESLLGKIDLFNEIHPFAFGVNPNGSLKDTLKIESAPWVKLREEVKKANVSIVPTILWGDAQAMHSIFADNNLLDRHVEAVADFLRKNNFPGVDIDYEGKDVADRDLFSIFLQKLHSGLNLAGKSLNCTVEARTQDVPPSGWAGTRAMAFANDYSVLNQSCDSVTVMAYDESFQVNGIKTSFENISEKPSAPNADNQWVEQVINYALRFIVPEKLILGVPTYGWEFELTKLPAGYRYTRVQSVSYPKAMVEARSAGVTPTRNAGGELNFVYKASDGEHIVTFADAETVKQKMDLAKKLNLKGICLFKLDGLVDPQVYSMLGETSVL